MAKVYAFEKQKDGKVHLTLKELQKICDECYWEGYNAYHPPVTITTPSYPITGNQPWWDNINYTYDTGTNIIPSNYCISNSANQPSSITVRARQ